MAEKHSAEEKPAADPAQSAFVLPPQAVLWFVVLAIAAAGFIVLQEQPPNTTAAVVAADDIPALTLIDSTLITTTTMPAGAGALTSTADLIGRFVIEPIAAGDPIAEEQVLLDLPPVPPDWQLLALPATAAALAQPGTERLVSIAPGPTEGESQNASSSAITVPVFLVAATDSESVVAAAPESATQILNALHNEQAVKLIREAAP